MSEILDIDDFKDLRQEGKYYVDKTRHLYRLAASQEPHFISRPPSLGKTILASSLEAVLRGRRDLFGGTWIHDSDYDWRPRPVISLSLDYSWSDTANALKLCLTRKLSSLAEIEGLTLEESGPGKALETIIKQMSDKHGCETAVIIDGCDAPIMKKRSWTRG
ncbi:MAG: AAA family ATPase [Deltaproteobacteria bacterium]|jgi:hypothetical protein|nr:AAA family ATPase [Deltaproteobacteria bacterium]